MRVKEIESAILTETECVYEKKGKKEKENLLEWDMQLDTVEST